MAHDHHDHSNCSHDHNNHGHRHGDAKLIFEIRALADEHAKSTKYENSNEPVAKADVDFIMQEMGLTKVEAERTLGSNKNDVVAALNYLITL